MSAAEAQKAKDIANEGQRRGQRLKQGIEDALRRSTSLLDKMHTASTLQEKTRIEMYVPDQPSAHYQDLLDILAEEFTEAFGGCTIMRGLEGRYASKGGDKIIEKMNVIYVDLPLNMNRFFSEISTYVEEIKTAAHQVLEEETILVTVRTIYHAE